MAEAMALSPVFAAAEHAPKARPVVTASLPDPGERDLVRRARAGDAAAREALVQQHRRAAYLLALQLLGNREDALDATQDALLRFLTTLDRFQPEEPVRPWLYSIVRNRCRDLMRRAKVRRSEPLESDDEHWRPEIVDGDADPELDACRAELRRRVFVALGRLGRE